MKTLTVVAIMAITLAVALPAAADVQVYGDLYYRINPPTGTYNPTGGTPWVWPALYTNQATPILMPNLKNPERWVTGGEVVPLTTLTLPANQKLLLGFENLVSTKWDKFVTIRIKHSGPQTLAVDAFAAGGTGGLSSCSVIEELYEGGEYKLVIKIKPQPAWEWITIKNPPGSSVVFDKVWIGAECRKIPSLTGWGIGALVILLAGTAMWLVRRRRPVLSS